MSVVERSGTVPPTSIVNLIFVFASHSSVSLLSEPFRRAHMTDGSPNFWTLVGNCTNAFRAPCCC